MAGALDAGEVSPTARDAVWARLIVRSWVEGIPWRVVAVGVAEPALRALVEELLGSSSPATTADDQQDDRDGREVRHEVESAVLAGFLEGLARADLVAGGVWSRLLSRARRAGRAALQAERNAPVPVGLDPLAARAPQLSALLTMTASVTSDGVAGVPLEVLLVAAVEAGALSEPEADVLRDAARRSKDPHAQGLPPGRAATRRRIEQRLADHLCHQLVSPITAHPSTDPTATSSRSDRTDPTGPASDHTAPDHTGPDSPACDDDADGGSGPCGEGARGGGSPAGELISSSSPHSSVSGTGRRHRFSLSRRVGQREPRDDGGAGGPRTSERLRDRFTRWSRDRAGVGPGVLAVLVALVVVALVVIGLAAYVAMRVGLAGYVALYVAVIRAVATGVTGVTLGPLHPYLVMFWTPEPAAVSALLSSSGAGGLAAQAPIVPVGSVDAVLTNIRNFLLGILAALATVFATVGGVRYVMSGGEPGQVEKAKNALRSAAVGFALAALAPLVVEILRGLVSA